MRVGVAACGIVLVMLGGVLVALFLLTDIIPTFVTVLQLTLTAGSLIFVGLVLLVVGLVVGSRPRTVAISSPQGVLGAMCPRCGGQLQQAMGKIRCPYCGKKVVPLTLGAAGQSWNRAQAPMPQRIASTQEMQRYCIFCGAQIHPLSNFCQRCGRGLRV